MAITDDIDLLNDEDEEDEIKLSSPSSSLTDLFGDRESTQKGIDNYVPESFYKEARDRASKFSELLHSNDKRQEPILSDFGKFRDKLDDTALDTPEETRMPFYGDIKVKSPEDFISEVNEQFKNYSEKKGESAFLGMGESDASERAKRGLPLKGEWDGMVSKYRALADERKVLEADAARAFEVRDEMTKRYLDYTDAQREALQDMYDAHHGDDEQKSNSRSKLSATSGYDPYSYGSTNEVLGYASKVAKQRRAIHNESNFRVEREKVYQQQRQLEEEGLRFSNNGYFAGFPLNVSKQEALILGDSKKDLDTAIATHGEENVEKARFSEKFNATLLDLRTAKHDIMRATASKDPEAMKEARASHALATTAMRSNMLQANDMGTLGELMGRPQTAEEMALLSGIAQQISSEKNTADGNVFDAVGNGLMQAWQQRKQSFNSLKHAFGGITDEEFVKDQQRLAGEQRLLSQPMGLSEASESVGDAGLFTTEFLTTMSAQIATHTPEGAIAGATTNVTGRMLEALSKAPLTRRVPLLRAALRLTGSVMKSKTGTTIGSTMGTVTSMEYGGAYLEAIGMVKNELFPQGVDALNADAHLRLLQDPESIAQVRKAALGRAVTIAAIESATLFAGSIATRTARKLGAKGKVVPATVRGAVDVGLGMGGEVGGMYVMHNTMGSDSPFVTFNKNAKGEYELGGYLGENLEDVILEGIGGPMIDATGTAFGKAYDYTAEKYGSFKDNLRKDLTEDNFKAQLEKISEEITEAEKGSVSAHRGDAKDVGEVTQSEYGTTGVIDTGRGKQYTYHTAKDNDSLMSMLVDRFGEYSLSKPQVQFLEKFFGAMEGANKSDWRKMKIAFSSEMEASVQDSPAAFDPKNNLLIFNTGHLSNFGQVKQTGSDITTGTQKSEDMSLVSNIVHEVGHFTERYMVGEGEVQRLFEGIDGKAKSSDGQKQGMFMAYLEYNRTERQKAETSKEAWIQSRKEFYDRYNSDEGFARGAKAEWWAMQFSRVAREQTKDMDKGVIDKIKSFFKLLREPYKDMIGDKNLSNTEVDKAIAELFGVERNNDPIEVANSSETNNTVDPEELARNSADLKKPVEEPVEETTDAEKPTKTNKDAFDEDQAVELPKVKAPKQKVSKPKFEKKPKVTKKTVKEAKAKTVEKPTSSVEVAEGSVDESSDTFKKVSQKKNAPLKRILFATKSTPEERAMAKRALEKRAGGDKPSRPAQKILDEFEKRGEVSVAQESAKKEYTTDELIAEIEKIQKGGGKKEYTTDELIAEIEKIQKGEGKKEYTTDGLIAEIEKIQKGGGKKEYTTAELISEIEKIQESENKGGTTAEPVAEVEEVTYDQKYASKAYSKAEQVLGKKVSGDNVVTRSKFFKVRDGVVVQVTDPKTGRTKTLDPNPEISPVNPSPMSRGGTTREQRKASADAEISRHHAKNATTAFKNFNNVKGKKVKAGSAFSKNPHFYVQDGKVVGVQDPTTQKWKGEKPSDTQTELALGARSQSNEPIGYASNEALQKQIRNGNVYAEKIRRNAFRADSATQGEAFHAGISQTYKDHPVGKAVEVKDLDFYKDPANGLFLSGDGLAGVAVTDYQDLVSVFKHPNSTAKPREILAEASQFAKTLDAYDVNGFLPNLYSEFGFKPVARVKFNREYAPEGWPYDLLGEPDIVLMVKDPKNDFAPIKMETKGFDAVRDAVPVMDADTAWEYSGTIGKQAEAMPLGARKGEPDHGLLGNVEKGEILYSKSGDLGMMNHSESIGAPARGNPWRYREESKTVYYWGEKPVELDKDAVEILLEAKGYEVKGLKHIHLNGNSPNFAKMYEDAHAFPLLESPNKPLGARPKGATTYPSKVTEGWILPDGSWVDASSETHERALREFAKKNLKHPLIKRMMSTIKPDQLEYLKYRKIQKSTGDHDALQYSNAFEAGLVRVAPDRSQGTKRIFVQGTKLNNEQLAKLEHSAIMNEYELWYDKGRDGDFYGTTSVMANSAEQLYEPPVDYLGARPAQSKNWLSKVSTAQDKFRVGTSYTDKDTTSSQNIGKHMVPRTTFETHMKQMDSKHLPTDILNEKNPDLKYEKLVTFFRENLIALHDKFPKNLRNRATHWYDGAFDIATNAGKANGKTTEQAAGVIAVMSPQKDWFQNVAQGEQFMEMWRTEQKTVITEEYARKVIEHIVKNTAPSASRLKKAPEGKTETERQKKIRSNYNKKVTAEIRAERRVLLERTIGKSIDQLSAKKDSNLRYWAMRVVLQTKFGSEYQSLSPEGKPIGVQLNDDGKPSGNGWGSNSEMKKAISILEDGSVGNITENLGDAHKVRNFYNNIIAPNTPMGDATIDTHAVAAAHLLPFSGKSHEVKQNFGSPAATAKGVKGMYYMYLEAYQQAAQATGLMPRQMQSITWEAVRLLYPKEIKSPKLLEQMRAVWQNENSERSARTKLTSTKISDPIWAGRESSGGSVRTDARNGEKSQKKAYIRGGVRSTVGRTPSESINGIELDPRIDPTGFNERALGARPSEVGRSAVAVSKQVFLDDSLSFVGRLKAGTDIIRHKLQDKMLPVRRLIEVMETERGGTFDEELQTYIRHENYHGKAGAELTNWSEDHELPIAKAIGENKVVVEVLDDFLHFRHAEERNRVVREKTKRATVQYRKNGRIVTKTFAGPKAENNAREFATGFKVSWDNTFADGTVETKTKEFKGQAEAEAFAKKKIKRSNKPNWPRQGNLKMAKGRLSGRSVNVTSEKEAGSGYSDELAQAVLKTNKNLVYALHLNGKINDAQRDRAVRVIEALNSSPNAKKRYENVAKMVDDMNRLSLLRQYKSGLISKNDYLRIKKAYKHYVPLMGWDDVGSFYDHSNVDIRALLNEKILPISQGMNTIQHKFRGSTGLQEGTMIQNHLAYSFALARQGIVESQKNEVMRSFFDLVATAHKDPALKGMASNFFSYTKGVMKSYVDKSGTVRKNLDPRWKDDPNVIGLKINGQTVALRLAPDRLDGTSSVARALKNLGAEKSSTLINHVKTYTRFMASMRTTFSPAFTAVNFFRDTQTALFGVAGLDSDFKDQIDRGEMTKAQVTKLKWAVTKNILNAKNMRNGFLGALHHATGGRGLDAVKYMPLVRQLGDKARNNPDVLKWAETFKDFSDNGGRINFFGFNSVQDLAKNFHNQVKDFDPDDPRTLKKSYEAVKTLMEEVSGAVENLNRVILYKTLVDGGISKQKSANMALNLTTNFTRKGEWTTGLNGMYLFFNAGVQGSYKILSTALKSKRARQFMYGYVALGFAHGVINRLIADEDEDGESAWDRVSPYSKTHNFHLFLPSMGDRHFKLPMPYGLNVLSAAGTLFADVLLGKTKAGDASLTLATTTLESYSPIGGTDMISALTPTALQPFTDLVRNKDYKEAPIYKENFFNKDLPDSSLYWNNTSDASIAIAKGLNKLTGGDEQRKGAIDVSPDSIEYMTNYFLGGLGSFMSRSIDGTVKVFDPNAPTPSVNDVPIVRRFVGDKASYFDTDRFYRLVKHTSVSKDRVEDYKKNRDPRASNVLSYEKPRIKLNDIYNKTISKQLSTLRRQLEKLDRDESLDGQARLDKMEALKTKRTRIMRKFINLGEKMGVDDY